MVATMYLFVGSNAVVVVMVVVMAATWVVVVMSVSMMVGGSVTVLVDDVTQQYGEPVKGLWHGKPPRCYQVCSL